MVFLRQFGIILCFSLLGEILHFLIPFPVPASVMPMMFIPAAVGLLDAWPELRPVWIPVSVITFVTTVIVMGATGRTVQSIIRRERGKQV